MTAFLALFNWTLMATNLFGCAREHRTVWYTEEEKASCPEAKRTSCRIVRQRRCCIYQSSFNPSPYDSCPLLHTSTSAALYIMYPNRKEMEVTESVVTMIKYHSWRLTGHQGPLTDTIRRDWRQGREGKGGRGCLWCKVKDGCVLV